MFKFKLPVDRNCKCCVEYEGADPKPITQLYVNLWLTLRLVSIVTCIAGIYHYFKSEMSIDAFLHLNTVKWFMVAQFLPVLVFTRIFGSRLRNTRQTLAIFKSLKGIWHTHLTSRITWVQVPDRLLHHLAMYQAEGIGMIIPVRDGRSHHKDEVEAYFFEVAQVGIRDYEIPDVHYLSEDKKVAAWSLRWHIPQQIPISDYCAIATDTDVLAAPVPYSEYSGAPGIIEKIRKLEEADLPRQVTLDELGVRIRALRGERDAAASEAHEHKKSLGVAVNDLMTIIITALTGTGSSKHAQTLRELAESTILLLASRSEAGVQTGDTVILVRTIVRRRVAEAQDGLDAAGKRRLGAFAQRIAEIENVERRAKDGSTGVEWTSEMVQQALELSNPRTT